MIELFKILNGIYDTSCVPQFDLVQLSERVQKRATKLIPGLSRYEY